MRISERIPFRRAQFGGFCLTLTLIAVFTLPARAGDAKSAGEASGKPPIDSSHPLYKPLELAYKSRDALKEIKDYEAIFTKVEANDRDRRPKTTTMKIKFREEPFSVYLLFVNP